MTTSASVRKSDSSRFYWPNGTPVGDIPKKSGNGTKKPTIADARESGVWLPSVTTIIKTLAKPALEQWKIEQACLAVLTTPRLSNGTELLDQFVHRVLNEERVQDEEAGAAADRGTAIHAAIEAAIQGQPCDEEFLPYVAVVLPILKSLGKAIFSEKVLVAPEYAGRTDYGAETDQHIAVIDFKTTKKVPKEAYDEHRMQVAAYCKALGNTADKHVIGGLLYISSIDPSIHNLCLLENWERDYDEGFKPLLKLWQYMNNYKPGS